MAMNTSSRTLMYARPLRMAYLRDIFHLPMPRPRTLLVAALMIGGLSIPALMAYGILPLAFSVGFVGFAMTITGGTLALIFSGEL